MSIGQGPPSPDLQFEALAEIAVSATARVDLCRIVDGVRLGTLVAVKRLHDDVADDPEFVRMFRDEVWMASSLNHENVVRVLGWGESREGPYFATEFVRGVSLARLMRTVFQTGEMFSERLVVFLASCICKGLDAAHELRSPAGEFLNLVHRDLTPENVLVSFAGDVKITDFGLAKAKRRASRTLTGLVKGAREYMAPEQIEGRPIDRRADIFALGVLLFELFSGQRPWLARSGRDTMRLILEAPPPDLASLRPGIHTVLVSLVSRCLAKDPATRLQTAGEVDGELTQWLQLHGYHENQDHLARFVRRNAMRQMRWVERAIIGEFAQGGGPNLAAAPPVSPDEEAAMSEADEVVDWPSVTGITRVESTGQPASAVRPTDQGWPQIEVSPTGMLGPEMAMDVDEGDDLSTLIQRPEHGRKVSGRARPAVGRVESSDSLPTIRALVPQQPTEPAIAPPVPTRAGLGPQGASPTGGEPSVSRPPSTRTAPSGSQAPARPLTSVTPPGPVPVPAAVAPPAAANAGRPSAGAPAAPVPPATPARAPSPAAPVPPATPAPAPSPAAPSPTAAVLTAPSRRVPADGATTQAIESAATGHPERKAVPTAATVPPTARGRASLAPPIGGRDTGPAGVALRRQAQSIFDDAGRAATKAASLAERATQAAERANAAAELAQHAVGRALAAVEAVAMAREACDLANAGRLDDARGRMAQAEQRRLDAKGSNKPR